VLFALRQPAVLLGLLAGFALGCFLRSALERRLAGRRRLRRQELTPARNWLDPFGVVAALLGGVGWSPRPELGFAARRRAWTMVVVGLAVHAALAAAGLAGYVAAGGSLRDFQLAGAVTVDVLRGSQLLAAGTAGRVCLGFAIANLTSGLLCLVPVPPLELGVALWSQLPRSPGSRRLAYRLLEEQWGVAVLLVLLLVPLAGTLPLLLAAVAAASDGILHSL